MALCLSQRATQLNQTTKLERANTRLQDEMREQLKHLDTIDHLERRLKDFREANHALTVAIDTFRTRATKAERYNEHLEELLTFHAASKLGITT